MKTQEYVLSATDVVKWYSQRVKSERFRFRSASKTVKAVDGVSLQLKAGEIMGIIGESGCGKSTLGKMLVRLENPTSGDISVHGVSSDQMLQEDQLQFRRTVQIVFQNPFDTFDPRTTIERILTDTLKLHKIGETHEDRYEIAAKALEDVGLQPADDYLYRYPFELSGGQLQRISILRAMLLKPSFLVADEPVSMLDVSVRAEIIKMLKDLVKNHNTALVFISHDISTTRYISDNVSVMYLGRIIESGTTDDVLHHPQHPYTKVLLSNTASIDLAEKREVITIDGEPPTPIDHGPGCYFAPRCYMAQDICLKEYPKRVEVKDNHWAACHFAQ